MPLERKRLSRSETGDSTRLRRAEKCDLPQRERVQKWSKLSSYVSTRLPLDPRLPARGPPAALGACPQLLRWPALKSDACRNGVPQSKSGRRQRWKNRAPRRGRGTGRAQLGRRTVGRNRPKSSIVRSYPLRRKMSLTCTADHWPPRAVGTPRAASSRAMARRLRPRS